MRRQHHRGAFAIEATHFLPQRETTHRVESRGGFVQEQHGWLVNQGERKVETSSHATRVGGHSTIGRSRETHTLQQLVGALLHLVRRNSIEHRLQFEKFVSGHQGVDCSVLQRNADVASYFVGLLHHVVSGDARRAAGGAQQGGEHAHRGALACTVGAEKTEDFTLVDGQVDAVDGLYVAEMAGELFCNDRSAVHSNSLTD